MSIADVFGNLSVSNLIIDNADVKRNLLQLQADCASLSTDFKRHHDELNEKIKNNHDMFEAYLAKKGHHTDGNIPFYSHDEDKNFKTIYFTLRKAEEILGAYAGGKLGKNLAKKFVGDKLVAWGAANTRVLVGTERMLGVFNRLKMIRGLVRAGTWVSRGVGGTVGAIGGMVVFDLAFGTAVNAWERSHIDSLVKDLEIVKTEIKSKDDEVIKEMREIDAVNNEFIKELTHPAETFKPMKIEVRSGDVIDAIHVIPSNGAETRFGGNSGGLDSIKIDDPIAEVSGCTGNWFGHHCVAQLTITTKSGASKTFGQMRNVDAAGRVPFSYKAGEGQKTATFSATTRSVVLRDGTPTQVLGTLDVYYA